MTNWTEVTQKNTDDIDVIKNDVCEIKTSIRVIQNNHLHHLEKDMAKQSQQIEKMDARVWWVLGLLVASMVIPTIIEGLK